MSIYNQVLNNFEELELIKMKEVLPVILDQNNKAEQPLSTLEILQKLKLLTILTLRTPFLSLQMQ